MFPILKTDNFYLWFLYKSDTCISCFRNDGEMKVSKVHRTYHSINGGSLEIPFKYNYIVLKNKNNKNIIKKLYTMEPAVENIAYSTLG